jgi:hypothetical protein
MKSITIPLGSSLKTKKATRKGSFYLKHCYNALKLSEFQTQVATEALQCVRFSV